MRPTYTMARFEYGPSWTLKLKQPILFVLDRYLKVGLCCTQGLMGACTD
jgi:hypothetical protein